ncbi:MAG: HAD family hydrolase [Candidatus Methanofastidiosa archaeon]|nr:HAD family hydrolase [Candidatus Methanofastidiosa archaeon]
MYDTFIIDLDGTLVTHEMDFLAHRTVLEQILIGYGLPRDKLNWDKSFISSFDKFKKELDCIGLDGEGVIEELIESIRRYETERAHFTREMEGAGKALAYLRSKGYKIAIVTRNNKEAADISIDNAGLRKYADTIITRDDVSAMAPKSAQFDLALKLLGSLPERTVVVGDYSHEIDAGNAMGCMTIGVLSGSGSRDSLKGASIVIDSIKDIIYYF